MRSLPRFISPTLVKPGRVFDSDDYLFEAKWDGMRLLAFIEGRDRLRLVSRRGRDVTTLFPELACLVDLPVGTALDGELVVLQKGRADFETLMQRNRLYARLKVQAAARTIPATYVVLDQLYDDYRSIMSEPLRKRRALLTETLASHEGPHLAVSLGVVGEGSTLFASCAELGLEGVVAKRLSSRYVPGRRTGAWLKAKHKQRVRCAVLGFVLTDEDHFEGLIVAVDQDGELGPHGNVSYGFTAAARRELNNVLWSRVRSRSTGPPLDRAWPSLLGRLPCPSRWPSARAGFSRAGGGVIVR